MKCLSGLETLSDLERRTTLTNFKELDMTRYAAKQMAAKIHDDARIGEWIKYSKQIDRGLELLKTAKDCKIDTSK